MWKTEAICSDKDFHKIQDPSTNKNTALLLAKRSKHALISPTRSGVSCGANEPTPVYLCLTVELCLLKDEHVLKQALDNTPLFCPVWLKFIGGTYKPPFTWRNP